MRSARGYVSAILVLSFALSACAGALQTSVQAAHVEAQVVEAASDAFAKLYLDDTISKDVYLRGRAAYKKWSDGQTILARTLAEWKRVGGNDSKTQLVAAISAATRLANDYLKFIGQFVDLEKVKATVDGGR